MQTIQAVIMGSIQGLTEFLPVSSSGHIVLGSAVFKLLTGNEVNLVTGEEVFFDILIHLSTLFAILIYFFEDIKQIVKNFFISLFKKDFKSKDFKFGIYILSATFITSVIGFFIKDFAHELTENPFIVSLMLIFTGLILFFLEKFKSKENDMNLKTALLIGLFQGLAVFPGISRSGMTISSAIFRGINRKDAAKFSFILSIPIILLASLIYPLISFDISDIKNFNHTAIIFGMLSSFIIGFLCIKFFMKYIQKNNLKAFAYYCFIVGVVFALIFNPFL